MFGTVGAGGAAATGGVGDAAAAPADASGDGASLAGVVVAGGVVAGGVVAAAPGRSAVGSAPTPLSPTTAGAAGAGAGAVPGALVEVICCGVPVESLTTGAVAIAFASADTTGAEANGTWAAVDMGPVIDMVRGPAPDAEVKNL